MSKQPEAKKSWIVDHLDLREQSFRIAPKCEAELVKGRCQNQPTHYLFLQDDEGEQVFICKQHLDQLDEYEE